MLRFLVWVGLVGVMLASLISFGGYWWPSLDSINHFRPFLFAGFALVAALALFARLRLAFALGVFLVLAQGWFLIAEILPEAHFGSIAAETAGVPLKVISFNMLDKRVDAAGLARMVERERPDVLVLIEAWPNTAHVLAELKPFLPYRLDCFSAHFCDVAILTRHPFTKTYVWDPPAGEPRENNVSLMSVTFEKDGIPVTVWGTHLDWPVPARGQTMQFEAMRKDLQDAGPNTILAGDFNSTPWSFALQRFGAAIPLHRITRAMPTWPSEKAVFRGRHSVRAFGPFMPLDHIFIGKAIRKTDVRRGPYLGSDHYPVIADLKLVD
ncbi:endonuclease/exonuclease/phosphatase family protein [Afifella sp. YEN Y35]|uniref:endonuclease/exonuclease/phosphatase family protein n=1 Tax=Afifella sp. YEN Y35 TaxID=3388337 RepID=UPI0039DF8326